MSLKTEFNNLKFDIRMTDINLGAKLITPEEVQSNLTSLEDCSANATQVNINETEEEVVQEVQATEAPAATDSMMGSFNPSSNPFGSDSN